MTTEEYGGSSPAFHNMTDAFNSSLNSRTRSMHVRRVNKTTVGIFTISTVRLPRDMDSFHQGQVYETMIFDARPDVETSMNFIDYQERCRTYSEAVQQHKDAVMYIELFVDYDEPDVEIMK